MVKDFIGEKWKTVVFDFEYANEYRLEVSNFGRLKSFHPFASGTLLKGSMINGYKIIRLKFYTAREPEIEIQLKTLQQQIFAFARQIKEMKQKLSLTQPLHETYEELSKEIEKSEHLIKSLKKKLSKKFKNDLDSRVIHYHSLIHRLVAEYFCTKTSEEHVVVAHKNFDKLDNISTNLVWMTRQENYVFQQKSPHVISGKIARRQGVVNSKIAKLTVTKVMLLKKMLNLGKPMRTLAKQFKITETQIRRIKKGENWADIEAAMS